MKLEHKLKSSSRLVAKSYHRNENLFALKFMLKKVRLCEKGQKESLGMVHISLPHSLTVVTSFFVQFDILKS